MPLSKNAHPTGLFDRNPVLTMNTYNIAMMAGDGIGPEIMQQAVKALKVIERRSDVVFNLIPAAFGASAWLKPAAAFPRNRLTSVIRRMRF